MKNNLANNIYKKYVKRILDVFFSLLAIIVLSPLFLVISLVIYINNGKPIIFKQNRPGYKGRIFQIYKFRSMKNKKEDDEGQPLSRDQRVTKVGLFLRKTSLDELPELFNIIKGDMSFVGPRPLLIRYLPYYTEEEKRRHDVKPGLTGYAQVMGRNMLPWSERFAYDLYYVDNLSFILDLKIFFKTIKKVLSRSDVADLQETKTDQFGSYLVHDGRIFRPLDEERKYERYKKELNANEKI